MKRARKKIKFLPEKRATTRLKTAAEKQTRKTNRAAKVETLTLGGVRQNVLVTSKCVCLSINKKRSKKKKKKNCVDLRGLQIFLLHLRLRHLDGKLAPPVGFRWGGSRGRRRGDCVSRSSISTRLMSLCVLTPGRSCGDDLPPTTDPPPASPSIKLPSPIPLLAPTTPSFAFTRVTNPTQEVAEGLHTTSNATRVPSFLRPKGGAWGEQQ